MISVTVKLDKSQRPILVPDHFIAYQVLVEENIATVSFCRLRDGDKQAWEVLAELNEVHAPNDPTRWQPAQVNLGSIHYMFRAPASMKQVYEMVFERSAPNAVWRLSDEKQREVNELVRLFEDPTNDVTKLV